MLNLVNSLSDILNVDEIKITHIKANMADHISFTAMFVFESAGTLTVWFGPKNIRLIDFTNPAVNKRKNPPFNWIFTIIVHLIALLKVELYFEESIQINNGKVWYVFQPFLSIA